MRLIWFCFYLGTMTLIPYLFRGIYFIFNIGSVAHPSSYSMGAGCRSDHTCICCRVWTSRICGQPPHPHTSWLRYAWLRTEAPWTNSMERNPSCEAKRPVTSHEISRMLHNLQVNYRIHMRPPPCPVLIQINPVGDSPSHFLNIIKGRGNANFILTVSED